MIWLAAGLAWGAVACAINAASTVRRYPQQSRATLELAAELAVIAFVFAALDWAAYGC